MVDVINVPCRTLFRWHRRRFSLVNGARYQDLTPTNRSLQAARDRSGNTQCTKLIAFDAPRKHFDQDQGRRTFATVRSSSPTAGTPFQTAHAVRSAIGQRPLRRQPIAARRSPAGESYSIGDRSRLLLSAGGKFDVDFACTRAEVLSLAVRKIFQRITIDVITLMSIKVLL